MLPVCGDSPSMSANWLDTWSDLALIADLQYLAGDISDCASASSLAPHHNATSDELRLLSNIDLMSDRSAQIEPAALSETDRLVPSSQHHLDTAVKDGLREVHVHNTPAEDEQERQGPLFFCYQDSIDNIPQSYISSHTNNTEQASLNCQLTLVDLCSPVGDLDVLSSSTMCELSTSVTSYQPATADETKTTPASRPSARSCSTLNQEDFVDAGLLQVHEQLSTIIPTDTSEEYSLLANENSPSNNTSIVSDSSSADIIDDLFVDITPLPKFCINSGEEEDRTLSVFQVSSHVESLPIQGSDARAGNTECSSTIFPAPLISPIILDSYSMSFSDNLITSDTEAHTSLVLEDRAMVHSERTYSQCSTGSAAISALASSTTAASETSSLIVCLWSGCGRVMSTCSQLVQHVQLSHVDTVRGREFTCLWQNCPRQQKPFNAKYKLLIHCRIHSGEKPNICSCCGKAFSRRENLKIHTRSHTGERPYKCKHAGCCKSFSNSSDRAKHQRTHKHAKPYMCPEKSCRRRYTDPSSLRKHIKLHVTTRCRT